MEIITHYRKLSKQIFPDDSLAHAAGSLAFGNSTSVRHAPVLSSFLTQTQHPRLNSQFLISWDQVYGATLGGTDMGDRDRLATDPPLSFEQYADLSHA